MSAVTAPLRRADTGSVARRVVAPVNVPVRPRLRVVATPRRRHVLAYAVLVGVIFATSVFGVVALNAVAAASAVEARELQARVDAAERTYGRLVAEVAALEDPGRIRALALEQGLVEANAQRYLPVERSLPADRTIGSGRMTSGDADEPSGDRLKPLLSVEP